MRISGYSTLLTQSPLQNTSHAARQLDSGTFFRNVTDVTNEKEAGTTPGRVVSALSRPLVGSCPQAGKGIQTVSNCAKISKFMEHFPKSGASEEAVGRGNGRPNAAFQDDRCGGRTGLVVT